MNQLSSRSIIRMLDLTLAERQEMYETFIAYHYDELNVWTTTGQMFFREKARLLRQLRIDILDRQEHSARQKIRIYESGVFLVVAAIMMKHVAFKNYTDLVTIGTVCMTLYVIRLQTDRSSNNKAIKALQRLYRWAESDIAEPDLPDRYTVQAIRAYGRNHFFPTASFLSDFPEDNQWLTQENEPVAYPVPVD